MRGATESRAPGARATAHRRHRSRQTTSGAKLRSILVRSLPALLAAACGPSDAEDGTPALLASNLVARGAAGALDEASYTSFESDPVRPVAVLERSGHVAVTNTVDDHLEIFEPTRRSVARCGSVQVGLQPVAVAVVQEGRAWAELWVVNHLSDSVSVVMLDLNACRAEVIRTLQVGDEPRDIVVARDSQGRERVFVATAHRGQNHPADGARLGSDLVTPPREKQQRGLADVLVFDPAAPSAPPAVVNLFGDRPRALAVADGVVYAASYLSGNRTTAIATGTVNGRGLESVAALLARDAGGAPIEQEDQLLLAPGARGQVIAGGLPAVAGSGRCLSDPRDEGEDSKLLKLCVETDAQHRVERVLVQRPQVVHPSCQCTSGDGTLQPTTGVIVRFFDDRASCGAAWTTFPDGSKGCWLDAAPGGVATPALAGDRQSSPMEWNQQVRLSLPDEDVFAIDVDDLSVSSRFSGVGTVLFGMAVQPETGTLFVTNTDAQNLTRFEGRGQSSSTSVIGHLHESRITVIHPATGAAPSVQPVHLNSHVDYSRCCDKDPEENGKSFAFPTAGAFSADGERFFFSALGSDKIGVVTASAVQSGFDHDAARASGDLREIFLGDDVAEPSGPVGLALDARRDRLYVKTHFDNELVVIDARRERITGRVALPSPEPESVTRGRSLLYNARLTSSHGDSACASCHVFGDFDGLAWDLGDPDGATVNNPGPFALRTVEVVDFRSNKGPMTTQTLRGLANHGAMHWRGDRTRRSQEAPGEQPDQGSFDEASSFGEFDVAVIGLNGNDVLLEPELFARFTDFALQLRLPPNPIRRLDDSLTSDQTLARALYFGCASMTDAQFDARTCVGLDGSLVAIEPATADCTCAKNPFVAAVRAAPEVRAFAESLANLSSQGPLRGELEALASDTAALPVEVRARVASAASSFAAGNAALLSSDLALAAGRFLSPSLAAALVQLSGGLLGVLDASIEHGTGTAPAIAGALFEALSPGVVPSDLSRDVKGIVRLFEGLAQRSTLSELVRTDELARGTSAHRGLLAGCDPAAAPACNLRVTDTVLTCNGCHRLDPSGNAEFGVPRPGFFGTDGRYAFENESQTFKIPHLRNQYQKIGMFGASPNPLILPESVLGARRGGFFASDVEFTGPQVRGFGFLHDGITDTLQRFHGNFVFVRTADNGDALDAFLPRPEQRAACIERFRQAPAAVLDAAPVELRPLLPLCTASGPLPDVCFVDASAEPCPAALAAVAGATGFHALPVIFAESILPLCFQLGSMTEGGAPDGACYPEGLRERAQLESFLLAFDTGLKPMVGQQLTLGARAHVAPGLARLLAAAAAGDCDLALRQRERGYLLARPNVAEPGRSQLEDRDGRRLALDELSARDGAVTLTCHPPSAGRARARHAAFGREAL